MPNILTWEELAELAYFAEAAYEGGRGRIFASRQPGEIGFDDDDPTFGGGLPSGWQVLNFAALSQVLTAAGDTPATLPGDFTNDFYDPTLNGSIFDLVNDVEAFAAYNAQTHRIIISVRGTEFPLSVDLLTDFLLASALPGLAQPLFNFVQDVLAYAAAMTLATGQQVSVAITGHSLGGTLAEYVAQTLGSGLIHEGAFFGSPGLGNEPSLALLDTNTFVHVTREQDAIGRLFDGVHAADTLLIDDYEFLTRGVNEAHSANRYVRQIEIIAESPVSEVIGFQAHEEIGFLESDGPNSIILGQPYNGHGPHNVVFGGYYNDQMDGSAITGSLILEGWWGSDTLIGGSGSDLLSGHYLSDSLSGNGGNDTLWGGTGTDYLNGGADNDTLYGGDQGDFYSIGFSEGADTIDDQGGLGSGQDVIRFFGGGAFSAIDASWFSIDPNGLDLLIRAYDGSNTLVLDLRIQNMATRAGAIEAFELYGSGNVRLQTQNLANIWVQLTQPSAPLPPELPPHVPPPGSPGSGDVVLTSANNNWSGGSTAESVWALEGADTLSGSGGNDTIRGGAGSDNVHGGDGDDVLTGDDDDTQAGSDSLNGGTGSDFLVGLAGNDALYGDTGDDTLIGGDGDDLLNAGSGTEWLDGGAGVDAVQIDASAATVALNFLVSSAASAAGLTLANGTHIRNVEAINFSSGSGDDRLIFDLGITPSIYLSWNYWNGGAGTDWLTVDMSGSSQAINVGLTNHNNGTGSLSVGSAQRLSFTNIEAMTVLGGSVDDLISATDTGDDFIFGNAGNDNLYGRHGGDVLDGGSGNDALYGDTGDDTLIGDDGDDLLNAGSGTEWLDGGAGVDAVQIDASAATVALNFLVSSAASAAGLTLANGTHIRNVEKFSIVGGLGDDHAAFDLGVTGTGNSFNGGGGSDRLTADFSSSTQAVLLSFTNQNNGTGGVWFGIVGGTAALAVTGVEAFNVTGGIQGDLLYGLASADSFFGNGGADTLNGRDGDDYLKGGDDNDALDGGNGDDILSGDGGNDQVIGGGGVDTSTYASALNGVTVSLALQGFAQNTIGAGNDTLSGIENLTGSGFNDTLTGDGVANVLRGEAGLDVLTGNDGADILEGGAGNDTLDGGNHDDELFGGDNADLLYGRAGNDTLDGGTGSNTLEGGGGDDTYIVRGASDVVVELAASGTDTIISAATRTLGNFQENLTLTGVAAINGFGNILANAMIGNDTANVLNGLAGADMLSGGLGTDTLNGGDGTDTLNGGADNDLLDGGNDADSLNGGDGADTLYGRTQNDTLNGEAGNDTIFGGDGDDVATGGDGDDLIDGLNNNDTLSGGDGADDLYGRQNNDVLNGDAGNDELYGGDGDDHLNGGADDDLLDGGNGIDVLNGGDGADTLYGRNGVDTLDGGLGADTLLGGNDADTFVFSTALGGGNIDTIQFYSVAEDTIQLDVDVFSAIGLGTLAANAFVIGAAATTADHRIIYDAATGALYYDADGDGAGAAVQFATLGTGLALTNADFVGGP